MENFRMSRPDHVSSMSIYQFVVVMINKPGSYRAAVEFNIKCCSKGAERARVAEHVL